MCYRSRPAISKKIGLLLVLVLWSCICSAQKNKDWFPIPVLVNVAGLGRIEFQSIIVKQKAYLPISDLFNSLKIKNTPSASGDSISGFFINEESVYLIDKPGNRIIVKGVSTQLEPDALLQDAQTLYLSTDYLGRVFGLNCTFNVR